MWASNVKDEFNTNMFTEWQLGRVQQIYFRKAVYRELWRRNVLSAIIIPE